MTDFEARVTEVLRSGAEDAPDAVGLADAARSRARARRRSRIAVGGVAAVAALAVPLGIVALGGDDRTGETPVADNSTAADPGSAGRWESWHGVTVQVPDDWGYGDLGTWCAGGGSAEEFRVGRPGGPVPMILCTPGSSYGVTFQDIEMDASDEPFDWPVVQQTGDAWPPGTYVGGHGEEGVLVTVAGPDRAQVMSVLATVQAYGYSDPNGCSPRVEDDQLVVLGGAMSVCRYDATGLLEQSERLTGSDATAAASALDATVQGDLDCQPSPGPGATITMYDGQRNVGIELDGACTVVKGSPGGIADADVLYWALSPGWTGDATGLPLPPELRS